MTKIDTQLFYGLPKSDVLRYAGEQDFDPKAFIELLSQNPTLKYFFESSAQVSEKYTIAEHTQMVLSQYERYFKDKTLPTLGDTQLEKSFFRTFLAFHDVGKQLSMEAINATYGQGHYGKQFMEKCMPWFDFNPSQVELAKALVGQDWLGPLMTNSAKPDVVFSMAVEIGDTIVGLAKSLDTSLADLLNLFRMYYMVDAGAYTTDAGAKGILDPIFNFDHQAMEMKFEPQYQRAFSVLERYIKNRS